MSARHYPYTGGDPGSPYFDAVPTWLNDLLLEQTPGREMRNFRLEVRKSWVMDCASGLGAPVLLARLFNRMRGTTGSAMDVAHTCIHRWLRPEEWPQTREEEGRRAQQA